MGRKVKETAIVAEKMKAKMRVKMKTRMTSDVKRAVRVTKKKKKKWANEIR